MEHDLAFDRGDFDRVRGLIYQRAGISLGDGKQAMVYTCSGWSTHRARRPVVSGRNSSTA
jgi:hypothetical protein